jgi:hypothetical protein
VTVVVRQGPADGWLGHRGLYLQAHASPKSR